nr:reverse transcriptase [Tanacetum cinerariifolium]
MFRLTTLADAFSMARMQEATNIVLKPRYNSANTGYKSNNFGSGYKSTRLLPKPTTVPLALPAPNQSTSGIRLPNTPLRKQLTQKEMEEKRAKNQCFYCDMRYTPGHKCSGHVYSLEVIRESEEQEEDIIEQVIDVNEEDDNVEMCHAVFDNSGQETPKISLNALYGVNSYQTMRVRGLVRKQPLYILVDSGVYTVPSCHKMEKHEEIPKCVSAVLQDFEDVFAVPTELPSQRAHDHRIPLVPNTPPIDIRLYRHPSSQKGAIEVMVKELMDSGKEKKYESSLEWTPKTPILTTTGLWPHVHKHNHHYQLNRCRRQHRQIFVMVRTQRKLAEKVLDIIRHQDYKIWFFCASFQKVLLKR